ncbi:isocitrate lyase/phosphoenolpyruvate mutase family protein [Nonomuraea sp. NPDC050153]|uniref:isocitrate lyase/phosphoenolpyruvate mutase family protein n=1 Tax=Nonomuraea sp. NPDC050153 TaxID=3364359 RepID=UPI0037A02122
MARLGLRKSPGEVHRRGRRRPDRQRSKCPRWLQTIGRFPIYLISEVKIRHDSSRPAQIGHGPLKRLRRSRHPGAYDGTGARLTQALGFQAVYLSGFQTSASMLGQPDVGYLTMTQMVARVAAFTAAVDLPAARGMRDHLETLATRGDTRPMLGNMLGFAEFNKLIGLDEHAVLERRYQITE